MLDNVPLVSARIVEKAGFYLKQATVKNLLRILKAGGGYWQGRFGFSVPQATKGWLWL
ncbi:MAG: hypothetical protein PHU14_07915 [Methylovulum sp.]|nr:hypothetical protein [Methylovulum sp.]